MKILEAPRLDLGLKGKNALVIASSQGLGRAVAAQLSLEGCHVMLTGRDPERLSTALNDLSVCAKGRLECCPCDITRLDEIEALAKTMRERLGSVDILVNNSGGPQGGGFQDLDDTAWQAAFELTLLSYVRLIRVFLPDLKSRRGRIINLASASVRQPIAGLALSNVFRLGVMGLSKTLADELAPHDILVTTVAPGRIATDRTSYLDELAAQKKNVSKNQISKEARQRIPLGRYGEVEEFAKVVCFLASAANSYMTGSVVAVDGGMIRSY